MAGELGQPAITGIGGVLGERSISNEELIAVTGIDSSPEWIEAHTDIEHRYWALDGVLASDLGFQAAVEALETASMEARELSGIYLTTLTPDYLGPYTATEVHRQLNASRGCFALEVVSACAGSVVGISEAADKVKLRPETTILTIGTEILSRVVNLKDRRSVILFGDGAGATVIRSVPGATEPVFSMATVPDREAIYAPAGGFAEPIKGPDDERAKLHMDGPRVARHALDIMPGVLHDVLVQDDAINSATGRIDWDRYDLFVPHQANGKLIAQLWEGLEVPKEKRVLTVDQHGNTSSASILLALKEAMMARRLTKDRNRILMTSVGAGMIGAAGAIDVHLG